MPEHQFRLRWSYHSLACPGMVTSPCTLQQWVVELLGLQVEVEAVLVPELGVEVLHPPPRRTRPQRMAWLNWPSRPLHPLPDLASEPCTCVSPDSCGSAVPGDTSPLFPSSFLICVSIRAAAVGLVSATLPPCK